MKMIKETVKEVRTDAIDSNADRTIPCELTDSVGKHVLVTPKTGVRPLSDTSQFSRNSSVDSFYDCFEIGEVRVSNEVSNNHIAYREYKEAGEFWRKTPKTDYTYSPLSPHRRALGNGYIGMPNLSRRGLREDNVVIINQPKNYVKPGRWFNPGFLKFFFGLLFMAFIGFFAVMLVYFDTSGLKGYILKIFEDFIKGENPQIY
ncbi:uncharacterized protein LOC119678301 [Teleopsis dalmanni]|uniref:uncharacterized protein LOC119678301 n=1 Tax=Teleopsis dalmanni TaxID=139649 RepID=UPI0018CF3B9E|nr:uncharacterized protein LOC119678301 [Teleopsis dalmanni]XP_037945988.1 uncharacterized protein LOC119678301 [Teleopsis dalmanni]